MGSSKSNMLLMVVALFFLLGSSCEAKFLQKHETRVILKNDLLEKVDMAVHCKSGNNDLGKHVIRPGKTFGFHFRPDFVCRTLFWCNFAWPGATRGLTVYDCNRDYDRCFDCTWSLKSDRPCLYNARSEKYDLCEKW